VHRALTLTRLSSRSQAARVAKTVRLVVRRATSHQRPLPDFLVIGAQKCGTSTLFASLAAHPQVRGAVWKEVHFFDAGPVDGLDWYRAHFPRSSLHQGDGLHVVTGEASPYYLVHPGVPERVRSVVPDARLLVILRDPVQRAASAYHHAVRVGAETRPPETALDPDAPDEIPAAAGADWFDPPDCPVRRRGYLARGRYAEQLERWLDVFPAEQLLVIETARLDDGAAPRAARQFLGLVEPPTAPVPLRNVRPHAPLPADLQRRLEAYFAPHDERLWALLGRRLSWA
jgi:Sulfotransferase domain